MPQNTSISRKNRDSDPSREMYRFVLGLLITKTQNKLGCICTIFRIRMTIEGA